MHTSCFHTYNMFPLIHRVSHHHLRDLRSCDWAGGFIAHAVAVVSFVRLGRDRQHNRVLCLFRATSTPSCNRMVQYICC